MTEEWRSVAGNSKFGQIVRATAYPLLALLKLPIYETAGCIERECDVVMKDLRVELNPSYVT